MPEEQTSPTEKRLADLEKAVAEMKERFEEMEDLIMVEQAGIVELQKMVEEAKGISMEAPEAIGMNLEDRLKKIEADIASIIERKQEAKAQVGGEVDAEKIYQKMDGLEGEIANVRESTEELRKALEGKITSKPEQKADYSSVLPRIENIEGKIRLLESDLREGMLQKFSGAKEGYFATLEARVESMENIVKNLKEKMEGLKEIEEKTRKISEYVSELMKDSSKTKNEILLKATEVDNLVKKVEETNEILSSRMSSEMESLNEKITSLEKEEAKPEEIELLKKRIETIGSTVEERYRRDMENLKSTITKIIEESRAPAVMDTELNELLEKIVFLEKRLDSVEKNINRTSSKPWILE